VSLVPLPRLAVAGLAGDTGKTLVSLGVTIALRRRGVRVAPFKKGPDYIDAAWLGAAAGRPAHHLDTFLMSDASLLASLVRASAGADLALIEGNRGLFDGVDERGTHCTAALARRIRAPIVLVVDASKATRTLAALVLGCRALEPGLPLAGVILNRVGNERHLRVARAAITQETGLPVLGAVPRLEVDLLPSRHLGLRTPEDHPGARRALEALGAAIEAAVDLEALERIAATAPALPAPGEPEPAAPPTVRVGVLRDAAFSFYYPENLAALEAAGAELVPLSPLADAAVPAIDALYAGGGFPEVHAAPLAENAPFRRALAAQIRGGLPVWAECGGLMYLARSLRRDGVEHPMVAALPVGVEQTGRPQGHGYVEACVDADNPFLPRGTRLRGHEFHYSRLVEAAPPPATALSLTRGVGIGHGRDGVVGGRVLASYLHLFAPGTPEWAPSLVRAARVARERAHCTH